jgi:putative addiction module component (TIGR02574 family)
MSSAEILDQLRALPSGDRRQVLNQIWEEFADTEFGLTPAQAAELDRRLEDHMRHPTDVIPWSDIKSAVIRGQGD